MSSHWWKGYSGGAYLRPRQLLTFSAAWAERMSTVAHHPYFQVPVPFKYPAPGNAPGQISVHATPSGL